MQVFTAAIEKGEVVLRAPLDSVGGTRHDRDESGSRYYVTLFTYNGRVVLPVDEGSYMRLFPAVVESP